MIFKQFINKSTALSADELLSLRRNALEDSVLLAVNGGYEVDPREYVNPYTPKNPLKRKTASSSDEE